MDQTIPPAPAPPPPYPVPTLKSKIVDHLLNWVPALVIGGALFFYMENKDRPQPFNPPLATAGKNYVHGLSGEYHKVAEQIRSGILADKASVIKELDAYMKPVATAFEEVWVPFVDNSTDNKKITNPSAAADTFEQVSQAIKVR